MAAGPASNDELLAGLSKVAFGVNAAPAEGGAAPAVSK
jgi:hypothetical protein